jgi:hypothetical protein
MGNQQPSLEERKVQRLSRKGVGRQAIGRPKWWASHQEISNYLLTKKEKEGNMINLSEMPNILDGERFLADEDIVCASVKALDGESRLRCSEPIRNLPYN